MWIPKKIVLKTLSPEKNLGPEKIGFQKKFGSQKNMGQIFCLNAENQLPTCPESGLKVGKPNLVLRFGLTH